MQRCAARVALAVTALAAAGLSPAVATAPAHTRSSTGFSQIRQSGSDVRYELLVQYDVLAKVLGLGGRAIDAPTDAARAAALRSSEAAVATYLRPRLLVSLDGVACDGALTRFAIEHRQRSVYAALSLSYACPGSSSGSYAIRYGVLAEGGGVVDDHTSLVDYALAGARGRFVFDGAHHDLAIGETSTLAAALRFVAFGAEHILRGLDHVLFLVALLLGASGLAGVLKVATAFTVAHSLTLALAVLGWVQVAAEIVEPLIALSIAYVAAENILGGASRHRLAVVFGFGLLHGLGFASALSFTDGAGWPLIGSLLTFNLGVELGQALIVALLFPLLLLVRRLTWSPAAHVAFTAAIAATGLVWFFDRMTTTA